MILPQSYRRKNTKRETNCFFSQCPYCHGGKHGDKDTFSINLKMGRSTVFVPAKRKHGHFVEPADFFGF